MASIAMFTLLVRDYDEAIRFYVDRLGFGLIEDTLIPEQNKRWVVVAPKKTLGQHGANLLLARASNDEQVACIGQQTGGRVMGFLHTDDFDGDYKRYCANGVEFVRGPNAAPYGMVAVFKDLYGNLWDLIGAPNQPH